MESESLWTCPACKRQFSHKNQRHTCGSFTVKDILKGNSPRVLLLYDKYAEMVKKCGTVRTEATKTRIGFKSRITFTSVILNRYGLNAHIILRRKIESPRFNRVEESLSSKNHIHHFRIKTISELDSEVQSWLNEAYKTG